MSSTALRSIASNAEVWLDRQLKLGRSTRSTFVHRVTPTLAAAMLERNSGNRPLNQSQVARHIDRLKRGDFVLHHHGIAFAKDGCLNDGQHRLTAIRESGIAADLQVTFGAERQEFSVIDQGRSRTAGDMLAILGETNCNHRAAIAKVLLTVKTTRDNPDPQMVTEYAMELRSSTMDDALHFGIALQKACAPSAAAVAYWWIATHSRRPERLGEFVAGLASGEGLSGAKLRLREWLVNHSRSAGASGKQVSVLRAAVIIHAWNAFISGRKTFSTNWSHYLSLPDPQ